MKLTLLQVILLLLSSCAVAKKLNYPRILLPIFQKLSVQFTLEVSEKGCFKWMSSRNDLIQISPVYNDYDDECSYKATVTVLTKDKRRNTAFVLAEDLETKEVLRCDVILDMINALDVLTTTRELYLEEAPETFELLAEDSQGNIFTTLEGIEFVWAISSQNNKLNYGEQNWQRVLRFLPFSESKYHEVPKSLQKFESLGLKGYMTLLEGLNTGTAKVTVRLPYPEYTHVPEIEVDIMVLANIILDPSDAHIMVGDTVDFKILQLTQGKLQEISSSNQYYLEIEDNNLATVRGSHVTGKTLGQTTVILRDRNVPALTMSEGESQDAIVKSTIPKAILTITKPEKIVINLLPHYNWITIEGEKHEIAVDLYTSDDQKIYLGPQYKVNSKFDESLFYVLKRSKNGSRIYGEAVKQGVNSVTGTFEKLSTVAEMQIFKELTIRPKRVIMPLHSKQHRIKFTAEGGDGNYQWYSLNPSFLHISQNGIAETKPEFFDFIKQQYGSTEVGTNRRIPLTTQTNVKVALQRNPKIFRTAEILFLMPVKLQVAKYNFETSLGDQTFVHIALYANANETDVPFTSCESLNFHFEFTNDLFQLEPMENTSTFTNQEKLAPNACHLVKFRAINVGMTYLRVLYTYKETTLVDEIILNVFERMQILNPSTNEIVLPLGASRNIFYVNGPQKLFNIEADLVKLITNDKSITKITEIVPKNYLKSTTTHTNGRPFYVFTVLCRKIGVTQMKFQIYNVLSVKNFMPYITEFITKIYCVKPRFLNLHATEKLRSNCPLELKNSLIHLKNKEKMIEIGVEILDHKNRKLMNISSLVIDWQIMHGTEKSHRNINCYQETDEELIEEIRIPYKDYLICSVADISENFKIKGTVIDYNLDILKSYGIVHETPSFGIQKMSDGSFYKPVIENEINFLAVNTTILPFNVVSILLSHDRQERIPMTPGSGYYDFHLSEDGIISFDFDTKTQELVITPHQIGHVQIEISDRCLMTESIYLLVSVVKIGSIKINVIDRVQIFKTIEASLEIYDTNGSLLKIDHNNLQAYEIHQEILNPSILSIHLLNRNLQTKNEIRYAVTGTECGDTKIIFHSGYGNHIISSEPKNIQVFPSLRLYPRNSTLIVGSSIQIHYQYGPQSDTNIVYSIQNQNIVSMDSDVVIAKHLGKTKITGKCMGIDPANGRQIVFSEDTIEINVVPLEDIRIRTPLIRIKSGAVMPAVIWGLPDISPMILGTLDSLRVIWSTNQPDVVDIFGIFSELRIEYNDRDLISVHIHAINSGKAKIQATVILPGGKRLSSFVEITVFEILELESPKKIVMNSILMPPRSTVKFKANMPDVSYKLENRSNGAITISQDGVIKSSEILGRDLIIVKTFDQNLPVDIEVKNIHYILTSVQQPYVKLKQTEERIPKGMKIVLKVSLHDNLGNEFFHSIEDMNAIKYELSHNNMVAVQVGNNLTISMNIYRQENDMMKISLQDNNGVKYADDFIKIAIKESDNVFPTKSIFSVGDIICFESPLTSAYWSSSDGSILSIDKDTGVGKIIGTRNNLAEKIVVINGDQIGSHTKYDIEIREADEIEFSKSQNIFNGQINKAYLVIRNHLQIDKFSNVISKNISKCLDAIDDTSEVKLFSCRLVSKTEIGQVLLQNLYTLPIFDKDAGLYACKIELKTNFNEILDILKDNHVNIELEVQLKNGYSDVSELKIAAPITVFPPGPIVADQIVKQGIQITGFDKVLQEVKVEPSEASMMEITPLTKTQENIHYKVRFLREILPSEELFVYVESPMTGQNIKIPIQLPTSLQLKCAQKPLSNMLHFLTNFISNIGATFAAILFLFATIWVLIFCFPSKQTVQRSNDEAFRSMSMSDSSQNNSSLLKRLNQSSDGDDVLSDRKKYLVYGDTTLSPQKRINRRFL